ncbi:MAG: response regulator [Lachnospiraceae bacterium]|nr:response regulator [Lachnospiraceae bacterium]
MPLMQYVVTIREEVACLLVLIYIAAIYFSVSRKKTYTHTLFICILSVSIINVILDAVTIYTVNNRDTIPPAVNHGLHIFYIASFPIFLWLLYLYIRSMAFHITEHRITLKECIPVAVSTIAIIILPMYYVESDYSDYSTGPADTVAYICAFVYFTLSVILLIRYRKDMEPKARHGIALSLIGLVTVVVAQGIVHQLLMTGIGITIINVALFQTVESPDAVLIEKLAYEKERADDASRAKSAFLARMSHEIRTPINAVLGMDEMILRESKEENTLEYAGNIKVSGNTLLSLINDILDFSKAEAGKIEIIPTQYDIGTMINDLYNMTVERAQGKGLELHMDVDSDIPHLLYGDEIRIKQCALNILTNAVKYTEKGSINFKIRHEKLGENRIRLCFSVKDTGIGMKPEAIETIFMPFIRAEEERNRYIEGTGLGMSITQQLLYLMGSELKVESKYGKGSEFSFVIEQLVVSELPIGEHVRRYGEELRGEQADKALFIAPKARILVVDDSSMNLKVISMLLKRTKVQVCTVSSGREALTRAGTESFDIYFIDHMMPEMDGIETLNELKKIPGKEDAVYIALTANAVSGARDMYLDAGFTEYLSKPVEGEKLEEVLLRYLPSDRIEENVSEETGKKAEAEKSQEVEKTKKTVTAELNSEGIESGETDIEGSGADDIGIEGIRVDEGIRICGDKNTYLEILKVFYEGIEERAEEIEKYYADEDWPNYRIKVHALKSSAKTIGALELSEEALMLEDAAAANNRVVIQENNEHLLNEYRAFGQKLSNLFRKDSI